MSVAMEISKPLQLLLKLLIQYNDVKFDELIVSSSLPNIYTMNTVVIQLQIIIVLFLLLFVLNMSNVLVKFDTGKRLPIILLHLLLLLAIVVDTRIFYFHYYLIIALNNTLILYLFYFAIVAIDNR